MNQFLLHLSSQNYTRKLYLMLEDQSWLQWKLFPKLFPSIPHQKLRETTCPALSSQKEKKKKRKKKKGGGGQKKKKKQSM